MRWIRSHILTKRLIFGVIPQISVILGPCAGGAVYSPALTDFIFMAEQTGRMFITGPKVIEKVTGEQVDAESLGGAGIHNAVSGNAHFSGHTEKEVLTGVRKFAVLFAAEWPDNRAGKPGERGVQTAIKPSCPC
nr:carboxyl transferase domain-containing protein [Bacillus subtilis]